MTPFLALFLVQLSLDSGGTINSKSNTLDAPSIEDDCFTFLQRQFRVVDALCLLQAWCLGLFSLQ